MKLRSRISAGVVTALLAGAGALATPAATASATPTTHQVFATQARKAGLTDTQSTELQRQVDATLAESGGRQTAANIVDLGNGTSIRLVVPGEKRVRDLATTRGPATGPALQQYVCPYGDFCAYTEPGYNGKEQRFGACKNQPLLGSGWGGPGSWYTNQTRLWMLASMYGKTGNWVFTDNGPGDHDLNGNWKPVWSITPC
ncbi:peptidase inhibitor family I36 protein [Streptomyces griseofuscus]|uniref:peptidase inhibitor family I36 protein n=1 Tax=Streptomyces griseofuscus TaxID=146922 RepID=UPI0037F9D195